MATLFQRQKNRGGIIEVGADESNVISIDDEEPEQSDERLKDSADDALSSNTSKLTAHQRVTCRNHRQIQPTAAPAAPAKSAVERKEAKKQQQQDSEDEEEEDGRHRRHHHHHDHHRRGGNRHNRRRQYHTSHSQPQESSAASNGQSSNGSAARWHWWTTMLLVVSAKCLVAETPFLLVVAKSLYNHSLLAKSVSSWSWSQFEYLYTFNTNSTRPLPFLLQHTTHISTDSIIIFCIFLIFHYFVDCSNLLMDDLDDTISQARSVFPCFIILVTFNWVNLDSRSIY